MKPAASETKGDEKQKSSGRFRSRSRDPADLQLRGMERELPIRHAAAERRRRIAAVARVRLRGGLGGLSRLRYSRRSGRISPSGRWLVDKANVVADHLSMLSAWKTTAVITLLVQSITANVSIGGETVSSKLSLCEAERIAKASLERDGNPHQMQILAEKTAEYDFGFVFQCAPKRFLETGDWNYIVLGAGALIVDSADRSVHVVGSMPLGLAISNYEKQWKAKHAGGGR